MRNNFGLAFSLALLALFGVALLSSQTFRAQARLFPIVIAVAGLALAVVQIALAARQLRQSSELRVPRSAPDSGLGAPSAEHAGRRMAAILGWIVAFTLGVWLLGFPLAVPLLTLAYLRLDARESWLTSVVFAAASGAVFYGLFVYAVRIPFEEGFLFTLVAS